MVLFSIIIPVYNTSRYRFDRCINSVLQQSYDKYELLVIDDGSDESHFDDIEKICKKDSRIRLIRQDNKGAGPARDRGICEANGDYIVFVDSDDVITEYMLEDALLCIEQYNADIVCGVVHRETEAEYDTCKYEMKTDPCICLTDNNSRNIYVDNILGYESNILSFEYGHISDGPVSKVCRTSIAKQVVFGEENFWDEDTLWNIKISKLCNIICVSQSVWYIYLMNERSQTHIFRKNCPYEFETRINQELALVKELFPQCMQGVYARIWAITYILFDTYLNHKSSSVSFIKRYNTFRTSIKLPAYTEMLRNIDFRNEKSKSKQIIKRFLKNLCLFCPPLAYCGWLVLLKLRRGIH